MRIGFDAKRAFCNPTGLGSYARTLISSLIECYPDHEYLLYTPREKIHFAQNLPQVHIRKPQTVWAKAAHPLWRSVGVGKQIVEDRLDLFHGLSHEIPHRSRLLQLKMVVTIHDLIYLQYPQFFPWIDRQVYDYKFRYSCNHADKIIAVSQQTKSDIVELFKIPQEKITVIYQSCHPVFYPSATPEVIQQFKSQYSLPTDYVLFVGSLTDRKNPLNAVKALCLARSKLDLPIVLVGKGPQKEKILKFIYANHFNKQVLFFNHFDAQELSLLYQGARLFVYPSLFEGFGIPVIEALFSKVPVLTSNVSCLPEAGGPYSYYVNPRYIDEIAEGMRQILGDSEKRQIMIEKSYEWVQQFHYKQVVKNVFGLYQSLCA